MDYVKLKQLIDSNLSSSTMTDEQLANWCNSISSNKKIDVFFANAQTIADAIGAQRTAEILNALESSGGALARFAKWVETDKGINLGSIEARNQLDVLVSLGIINQQESDILKSLAEKQQTIAEEYGINGKIYPGHIQKARAI